MARHSSLFFCSDCGGESPQWVGRCPACGEWNTLVAAPTDAPSSKAKVTAARVEPRRLSDLDAGAAAPWPTGVAELDRVLGGGLVPGSVTLLGGEPGVGKSTLLLQVLASGCAGGQPRGQQGGLLVSAEESGGQVKTRSARLGLDVDRISVLDSPSIDDVCETILNDRPALAVVDSIQTVRDPALPSAPGSVGQVTACAQRLVEAARASGAATVLVGHVTKDGGLAGPRVLEHMVDTVLTFEGDQARQLRMLRAVKHRFGSTGELGLFEMSEEGLVGVTDPGSRFVGDRRDGTTGSAVAATVDGHRTLVVEVQALVVKLDGAEANPRWATQGIDQRRLSLLTAVLAKRADVRTSGCDVYAATTGGAKITEPGADLALCLALASSKLDLPVPADLVAFGEVGLSGEVRAVGRSESRLREAVRLGFKRALVPTADVQVAHGLVVTPVLTIADALAAAGLQARRRAA